MISLSVRALTREILDKNRQGFAGIGFGMVLSLFLMRSNLVPLLTSSGISSGFSSVILIYSFAYIFLAFSHNDPLTSLNTRGYPQHIFLLPIPSRVLALVPIITGSLAITFFLLLWCNLIVKQVIPWWTQFIGWLGVVILFTWIQGLSWTFWHSSMLRMLCISVVLLLLVAALPPLFLEGFPFPGKLIAGLVIALLFVGGYLWAFTAAVRSRSGDAFQARTIEHWINKLVSHLSSFFKPQLLSNGIKAQQWYDSKTIGWNMPIMFAFFGFIAFFQSAEQLSVESFISVQIFVLFVGLPAMGSEYASIKIGSYKYDLPGLVSIRPISDLNLAWSKLKVTAYQTSVSLVIYFILLGLSLYIYRDGNPTAQWIAATISNHSLVDIISGLMLSAALLSLCAWILIALPLSLSLYLVDLKPYKVYFIFVSSIAIVLIFTIAVYKIAHTIISNSDVQAFLIGNIYLVAFCVTTIITILPLILVSYKYRHYFAFKPLKPAIKTGVIFLSLSLVLVWLIDCAFVLKFWLAIITVNLALLAFLPILISPVAIYKNRHRC